MSLIDSRGNYSTFEEKYSKKISHSDRKLLKFSVFFSEILKNRSTVEEIKMTNKNLFAILGKIIRQGYNYVEQNVDRQTRKNHEVTHVNSSYPSPPSE